MSFNTLAKSLDIVDLLTRMTGDLNVTEISEQLNMPKSTAYKYLAVLRERGFLEYDSVAKTHSLGFRLLELASLVQSQSRLDKIALPHMKRLYQETKETVILAVLKHHKAYCLERIEGEGGIVFNMRRGSRLPLYGAAVKVLLAFSGEDIDLLYRNENVNSDTSRTMTDLHALKAQLQDIRKAGYAFADQELHVGIRAVAAPVFDDRDHLAGALDIVGPVHRLTDEKIEDFKEKVIHYAKLISDELKPAAADQHRGNGPGPKAAQGAAKGRFGERSRNKQVGNLS
jgi:DNA-binding IclR family transcriptional regulator